MASRHPLPLVLITLAAIAVLGLSLGACGDGDSKSADEATPGARAAVITSSDIAVGAQRFSFVILDGDVPVTDKPSYVRFFKVASPDRAQLVGEGAVPWSPLGAKEAAHGSGEHTETELSGVYFVNIEFDVAGTWGVGISVGDKLDEKAEVRLQFTVKPKNEALAVGEKAVAVTNPTTKDRPLKQVHTGSDVDPEFHTLSIADAVTSGKPSVIVFATPSFCRTRTCGPSLQVAINAAKRFGGKANFVHVEPYELDANGGLATDAQGKPFQLVEAGLAWRLPTEPWVFVVDASGTVVARFDGPYALEELEFALQQVTS